ncbi:MAG: hypothetical protein IJN92_10030 [Lachnospiraceae bacterium]|nr:hypothetical protein [Lachnospiraceae bacterium]
MKKVKKVKVKEGTIFDDVFRTILERMPSLAIPLINEVFHTDYPEDEDIKQYRNEHITVNGKVITDSCLGIRDRIYHIECQSTNDNFVIIRMIEYDFAIALEQAESRIKESGEKSEYTLHFPNSCVLYLRNTRNKDSINMKVILPNGKDFLYEVPVIRLQDYTKDEIFQKKLLMLLPFYVMKYEKEYKNIEENSERLNALTEEYQDILGKLDSALSENTRASYHRRLVELMRRISDYMLKPHEKLKERMGSVMYGKVLELETDKIMEEGMANIQSLYELTNKEGRMEDFLKAMKDLDYMKLLLEEYGI